MPLSNFLTTQERRIGGTDAAQLLGLSKHGNARDVYERIVNCVNEPMNPRMARGIAIEPEVRRRCLEANPGLSTLWTPEPWIVRHNSHDFATCSPDDVTDCGRLLEYKTASVFSAKRWGATSGVPSEYLVQVLWNLWVTQLRSAILYVAFGVDGDNGEFEITECRQYGVTRDEEMESTFADVGAKFWNENILKKVPPDMEPLKNKRRIAAIYRTERRA